MKLEHLQRYASVQQLVGGRRVADIASGEGYGAAILARQAACVIGVDQSVATVQYARRRYRDVPNVGFVAGRCEALPLATGSIDVIVSFETIEHLHDHEACLDEFRRVLAPGGRLVISTPDASQYVSTEGGNPFHVHELTLAEFKDLVEARFRCVRFWGQRPAVATFTYALGPSRSPAPAWRALRIAGNAVDDGVDVLPAPVYAVAVCSDGPLDDVALDTVIVEPADDAYASLLGIIRAYQTECERLEGVLAADTDSYRQDRDAWLAQKESLTRERESLALERESLTAEVARQALAAANAQRELDVVVQSKSWRMTAPLREWRQSAGRRKHAMALGLERRLRTVFRSLPLRGQSRWKLKTAVFERTRWLMRGTASYQHWDGTQRRARSASRAALPSSRRTLGAAVRLSTASEPVVSVVIPAYGQVEHTRYCLAALAECPPKVAWEVILVDDASPEDLRDVFSAVDGLRIVRNETNVGFIHSCNRGAREARGRYLCFLNNDTEVTPGWCDELLATLHDVPDAGLVGAKLVYPDGSLQESGGIIWRDGSGWNVGKFDDPAQPEYCYRREVDYVSGAAIMIPASLFWELGGFDTDYAPAYGEDSDLAFKVRAAGRRVLVQPLSVVIHHEGATAGTDLASGVKSHQVRNQQRLATRWAAELAAHFAPGEQVRRARERGVACRALVLDLCTPEPDKDAGSITAFNIMDILQRLGCGVTFAPVDNFLFLDRYTTALQRRGVECLYAPFVTSIEDYLAAHGKDFDLVLIFRFVTAARHLEAVRKHAPHARVWLHTSDLHFLREQREAVLRGDSRMAERALMMKQDELRAIAEVDCTIVHSTFEQELLAREVPEARVAVFGWAIDAPGTAVPFTARRDIGFIGGYQHPPNVDAALYFTREILPLVRQALPDVRFHVIGSNPPDHLRALAGEAVSVTGFVPDLVPVLDGLRLSVAPLRYGAGIKGKIGTSLGHGLPCVATTLGVEGMGLDPEREVLVADSPQAFADAVVRLYTDEALWQQMSDAGVDFVRRQYSFDGGTTLFRSLLAEGGLPAR